MKRNRETAPPLTRRQELKRRQSLREGWQRIRKRPKRRRMMARLLRQSLREGRQHRSKRRKGRRIVRKLLWPRD